MFRLPFLFIATGLVCFAIFDLSTIVQTAGWIVHSPRVPAGWFHVHLLVLGWATMIAMGAVYQLLHVILQKDVISRKLGYIHYVLFTLGLVGLLIGFAAVKILWIALFAALTWIGMILFALNIALALIRAAVWNPITISTACAVGFLVLTGLIGLIMGLNFGFNLWPAFHENLFYAHIWMGTVGWFGLLITGFSYKMLPMFYLSHGVSDRTAYATLGLWCASVLTGAAAFLTDSPYLLLCGALGLLTLAVCTYNVHITRIRKARHKKSPGSGILVAVYSARGLAALSVGSFLFLLFAPERTMNQSVVVMIGWAYIWGWVALTILGYLSKIVPFLWWTHKYGPLVGKGKIPTMADLLEDRYVAYGLTAVAISLLILIAGLSAGETSWIQWGGAALSYFSLAYMILVARVFAR